ncbi:MAG: putative UTP--glucose-1-phosphate uridylyltransferase [Chloroflexi bacterium]|nr:putative UTP--glucose-1-phosphate uridylyltransferase [Chloroflexota bacterium]
MKIFVPGRICLFGEHSDWAGGYRRINAEIEKGYTLICGTDQGIYAEIEPHPTSLVLTSSTPDGQIHGPYEIPMEPKALLEEALSGSFWSYIAGVAYQVLTNYHVRGLVIHNYKTDLPVKKGLSSSAAICVLTARAFNRVYDLKLTVRGEMELAYQGEITTPSRCGRMDQGCAFGNRPVLMTFDGDHLETTELQVNQELYFVIVDLNAQKDTMEILNRLNRCYPFAENDLERGVQELLGPVNKEVVHQAIGALQSSDAARLGLLMTEAQSLFDKFAAPICPEELTSPVLHRILSFELLKPIIFGGKGMGSQGDGTAQFLARSQSDQDKVIEILEKQLGLPAYKLTLRPGLKVRKALIPAAGFGTRLFPASKATKKELFPIIDRDGIAKPAILLIVEEALDAGLEEVIIVVQENDLDEFENFFNTQVSIENYNKLPSDFQEYARRIVEIGRHIKLVIQPVQEGFGHAVYCAREALGDEPFLLMLGDHLYRSTSERSCAHQLLIAYQQHGTSIVGLRRTPEDQIANFGTVAGVWMEKERLLNITEFAEKPNLEYARISLRVPGLAESEYLTIFGEYIIKPQIFNYIEENIKNNIRERGEFQLTSALDRLRQEDGFQGLIIDGKRYDIGLPQYYLETLQNFSKSV